MLRLMRAFRALRFLKIDFCALTAQDVGYITSMY